MQEGEQYAKENGLTFLETSAKTAHNVNELFYEIGNSILSISYTEYIFCNYLHLSSWEPLFKTLIVLGWDHMIIL